MGKGKKGKGGKGSKKDKKDKKKDKSGSQNNDYLADDKKRSKGRKGRKKGNVSKAVCSSMQLACHTWAAHRAVVNCTDCGVLVGCLAQNEAKGQWNDFARQLQGLGLTLRNISADGNCLFR